MNLIIPEGYWRHDVKDTILMNKLLGLPDMDVITLERDPDKDQLHFIVKLTKLSAPCPVCSNNSTLIHQYEHRTVRDYSLFGSHCFINFEARRFFCKQCNCPFTETLEWLEPNERLTRRYRECLFELCRQTSLKVVAERERIGYKTLERLYYELAEQQIELKSEFKIVRMGVDEIALLKGHGHYVLMISDLDTGRIVAVLPDRKKETLQDYLNSWTQEQRDCVKEASMDLWEPYAQAIRTCLPTAQIVADRFHVMKLLTDQVSAVRREIQRSLPDKVKTLFKGCRWLLVRNEQDLSVQDKSVLSSIFELSPILQTLHELKEKFRAIFEKVQLRETASLELKKWIQDVEASGLKQLSKFVSTLLSRWEDILNYFNTRLTSGKVEGLNNKAKVIKRTGYGYRNFEHFMMRILIECDGTA